MLVNLLELSKLANIFRAKLANIDGSRSHRARDAGHATPVGLRRFLTFTPGRPPL